MKNFWAVIILLAVILGLGLYFSSHSENTEETSGTVATSTDEISVTVTKNRIEDKENKYIATIETPTIIGHVNAGAFNNLAQIYVDRATEQFAQSATEANFNIPATFKNQSHGFIATAEATIIADRYVSVLFTREYDMLAAAHPFHMNETLVYDLETVKVIELSDIFTDVSRGLDYVAAKATEQIKAHLAKADGEESFIAAGASAQEANYRAYTITDSGITFYFAEYQVAPYAAGSQKAVLTWTDLRPLLTTQFKLLTQ